MLMFFMMFTILLSIVLFVLESEPSFEHLEWVQELELIIIVIFSTEFLLRFLLHDGNKISWLLETFNLIDLFSIAPWYLEQLAGNTNTDALRVLRNLRLARLFRVTAGTRDTKR